MTQHQCAPDAAEIPKKGKVASIRFDIIQNYIWTDDTEHQAFNYIIPYYFKAFTGQLQQNHLICKIVTIKYIRNGKDFFNYFSVRADCSVDGFD